MESADHDTSPDPASRPPGGRLSREDALALLHDVPLVDLGQLADRRRRALHGDRATWVRNLHINATNICTGECRFCAFRRRPGQASAFAMAPAEVLRFTEENAPAGVREFHLVGGLHEAPGLAGYEEIMRGLAQRFPGAVLKALTAVEVAWLAERENLPIDAVLERLRDGGASSLTGGGAEIFAPRVRALLCPDKIDADGYIDIHRRAHRIGLRSTATMLFGHVETREERIDHLLRLRDLQDETGGLTAFVPLVFHPANTALSDLQPATGREILETVALARLILDNVAHIKAYWISLGLGMAQTALRWGADDLDGTVGRERIHHDAGASSPESLTPEAIRGLIRDAGLEPVERDGRYMPVPSDGGQGAPVPLQPFSSSTATTKLEAIASGRRRLEEAEARDLLAGDGDLLDLRRVADAARRRIHPAPVVSYVVDRNINTTNRCESLCEFCAFACPPRGEPEARGTEGWVLDRGTLTRKIEELREVSKRLDSASPARNAEGLSPPPSVLLQGGLDPELDLAWYEDLFRWMRERWPDLYIHALSPPEIHYLSRRAGVSYRDAISRLRDAGLDSLPGGGAEILTDPQRRRLSPRKCSAREWLAVMRTAHEEGLRSTATMVIGFGESAADRARHLEEIRRLQDETGGFTAFIPWTFQPANTPLARRREHEMPDARGPALGATACEYLRTLAVARLYLDNVANVQASWVTQGAGVAQVALLFGANDLGSTMLEENVVAAAGARFRLAPGDLERMARDLGLRPVRRDFLYRLYPALELQ